MCKIHFLMNISAFAKSSQKYLGNLFSSTSFSLEDKEEFVTITEPYSINGTNYQIYPFKKLTGYLPDPKNKEFTLLH